jgi:hypothetical protein
MYKVVVRRSLLGIAGVTDKPSLDDSQPSTLIGGGKSTVYPTLQEAMRAWHRLPPEQARRATIKSAGDRIYTPIEIVRFHHRLKTM